MSSKTGVKATCNLEAQVATDVFLLDRGDVVALASMHPDLRQMFSALSYSAACDDTAIIQEQVCRLYVW